MIYKILGIIIVVAALAVAYLTLQDSPLDIGKPHFGKLSGDCKQLTPAEQLIQMIDQDFAQLKASKALPARWDDVATVEYRMDSTLAAALLGKRRPLTHRVQNGKSFLEVEIMDLPDAENPGIILQISLFDIPSRNKIFEIGRTYLMNELNHVPKPAPTKAPVAKPVAPPAPTRQQGPPTGNRPSQDPVPQGAVVPSNTVAPVQAAPRANH